MFITLKEGHLRENQLVLRRAAHQGLLQVPWFVLNGTLNPITPKPYNPCNLGPMNPNTPIHPLKPINPGPHRPCMYVCTCVCKFLWFAFMQLRQLVASIHFLRCMLCYVGRYIYICMHARLCWCVVSMYVCMYICMCICMYICTLMYLHTYTWKCIYIYTHTFTCTYIYTLNSYAVSLWYIHIHIYMYTHVHTRHACIYTWQRERGTKRPSTVP